VTQVSFLFIVTYLYYDTNDRYIIYISYKNGKERECSSYVVSLFLPFFSLIEIKCHSVISVIAIVKLLVLLGYRNLRSVIVSFS
jgi:hypothetical protein